MLTIFFIVFITCYTVTSESVINVTKCEGDCDVLELYKKFVYNVIEINSEYVGEECRKALTKYREGLKNYEYDAVKSIYE